MQPNEFINVVFIHELKGIVQATPYISFLIITTGIEFLGKCLDLEAPHWNVKNRAKVNFEYAINQLNAFENYRPFLESHRLWDSLRNGFSHSFVPKFTVTLSSKNEMPHLTIHHDNQRVNLRCEDFYTDFSNACIEVIKMDFPLENKMNRPLISVPELED
jgi:hypothetical protein